MIEMFNTNISLLLNLVNDSLDAY